MLFSLVFYRDPERARVIRAESDPFIGGLPPAERAPLHPLLFPKEWDDRDEQEEEE
jgi:hypothetical protein